MECNKASQLLNAYADSELSKSDQSLLEAHLAECRACRNELEDIQRVDAQMRSTVVAPDPLRSAIASRLEREPSRSTLKEKVGMKYRWGLAAVLAAGLIVVGVMSTGGSAQATLAKMRKAVTEVHTAHLKIELNMKGVANHISSEISKDKKGGDHDIDIDLGGMFGGDKNTVIEFWAKDNRWKMDAFGGFKMLYNDGILYTLAGDKAVATAKVPKEDMPEKLGDLLFNELSKAQDELKKEGNIRFVGEVREGGRTLRTLEVTGLHDDYKNIRLMYWVDEETDLPARFQVWAKDDKGQEQLVTTITCDFNQEYPDAMFQPGGDKP
ncbi:MAG: putative zinc-finger [Fimbriimonadaceae bacterium]|jgi:outer membrane lipoprotein-sorting protein|nr:putative zinc-finger [Fimbriimonadaceae bacterium]